MQTSLWGRWGLARRQRQATAWGALLDEGEILLVALARQRGAGVRVLVFEQLHAPAELHGVAERDDWLVQNLRQSGAHLPASLRTMALAVREGRCRHGVLDWSEVPEPGARMQAEVQLEAASVLGVDADEVGFDFHVVAGTAQQGCQVHWAACLRSELARWRGHARSAGWQLPIVEPELQAARRAALRLQGDGLHHAAQSPQDWQFGPERALSAQDWAQWQASPLWGPLVACGAALGALP